ncbi:carboxylesterase family protein [Pleomorphovibrio marinus]|uniref:carboxylesterase family protein n=1 Tax=Pleomorphovibrio marinus TaxID=2164132 RepID=UPI000E0A8439|nr:dienelactone hydrolase family protein [Pleomorphovibrio marinus]
MDNPLYYTYYSAILFKAVNLNEAAMDQTSYKNAVFFSGLIVLAGLIQAFFYSQMGARIYGLESFVPWFLLLNVMSILFNILLLKYFHHKKYRYAFITLSLVTIATIVHAVVVFLILWTRESSGYLPFTFLMLVGSGVFYGLSLMLTRAGDRPWLKIGGILIILVDFFLFSTFAWTLQFPDSIPNLDSYHELATQIGLLIPLALLLNFWSELRGAKPVIGDNFPQMAFNSFFGVIGAISLLLILVFGTRMSNSVAWFAQQPQRAQRLAEPFDARFYVDGNGDTLRYRLMQPLDLDPEKMYPIVVALHGGAGSGTDNVIQVDGSWTAQLLAKPENREKYPSFVFVPQCPPGSSWGLVPNIPVVDDLVFEAIKALEAEFPIHKSRRYVMGESLGGYGSWHFISSQPDMFAAAVPICGGGNPTHAAKIADVPIWAFHGAKDRVVPVEGSRKMIAAIENAGGNPRYTEFANEGHIISESFEKTEGLLDWVFGQVRFDERVESTHNHQP